MKSSCIWCPGGVSKRATDSATRCGLSVMRNTFGCEVPPKPPNGTPAYPRLRVQFYSGVNTDWAIRPFGFLLVHALTTRLRRALLSGGIDAPMVQ